MRQILFSILFLSVTFQTSNSQNSDSVAVTEVFVSTGYSNSNLRDVRALYDHILEPYRLNEIPVIKQKDLNGTWVIEGGLTRRLPQFPTSKIGVVFGYLYSPAYAKYMDYAGTLNVNAFVSSFRLSMLYERSLLRNHGFELYSRVEPGVMYSWVKITEDLTLLDFPQSDYSSTVSASGLAFCVLASLGAAVPIQRFQCSFEAGYCYSNASTKETSHQSRQKGMPAEGFTIDIDRSGFVFLLSVGFQL